MSIENLKSYDPFAEADDDSGQTKQTQEYIHIRIQRMCTAVTPPLVLRHASQVLRVAQQLRRGPPTDICTERNGRKTLTTVQGIPAKFDHKKILKVVKKDFACNGTIISDTESKGMGEVIQLQGDQRLKIKEFLTNKDEGLGLDEKTIKVHGF
jgi:translation initiation factor 1